jgi:hypothetical protein
MYNKLRYIPENVEKRRKSRGLNNPRDLSFESMYTHMHTVMQCNHIYFQLYFFFLLLFL